MSKLDRFAQAQVHLKLMMQALEGLPEGDEIREDARALWRKMQDARRADQPATG